MGETKEAQGARMLQANEVLKRLGGKWLLHAEAQRTRVQTYPTPIGASRWQVSLTMTGAATCHRDPGARETRYYLTLTWQPPTAAVQHLQRLVVANLPEGQTNADGHGVRHGGNVSRRDRLLHAVTPAHHWPCASPAP